ncbi:MAG: phosphatidylglycerophosphate synthase [Gammaproteobacteria bacterium]|jgi:phosphatidylglycerophosphate synthase
MNTESSVAPTQLFPLVRQLSYRLTPVLLKTPITPNQITALSLLFGLLCAVCFMLGNYTFGIIGALFLTMSYTLDNCDGEVARFKNMSSEFGAKFDDMVDWMVDASFFAALGYGTSQYMEQPFWFWLGCAAAAGAFIDYLVDLFYYARNKQKEDSKTREERAIDFKKPVNIVDWLIYIFHKLSRADFCIIVLVLALFNFTWILLPFAAIGAQVYWVTDLFDRSRGFRT